MFVTKLALPRRAFLRGVGATVALPMLDAMVPAATAIVHTAAKPVQRLGFFYVANGCTMGDWHPKMTADGGFDMSRILAPLAPARSHMVVVGGLANAQADTIDVGSGPHTRCHATWLSGTKPKRTEGADILGGTSIDQYAALQLGKETPLMSLEMALEPGSLVGNCDNGYACVYKNTFSWRTPTTPMTMEHNPRVIFERLFGDGSSPAHRALEMRRDRSILDAVTEDMNRLQRRIGPSDRVIVDEYLESIRQVESAIQRAEARAATSTVPTSRPAGVPDSNDDHARLMLDLQLLGYQADVTRVVSFQFAREESQRTYPQVGVPNGHHDMSHHKNEPERMEQNTRINTYHVSLYAYLVEKMRTTMDGDGTLLDHSMLVYGSGMGDGDQHNPHDLPVVITGGGCGTLKGNRYLKAKFDTPMMNLGLSLLDKVGVNLGHLGDSSGRLADL